MIATVSVLVIVIIWSALSRPLDRRSITSAMFLATAGLVVALIIPAVSDIELESEVVERVAEIALVLLLFSDATRLDLRKLRHQLGWPSRLLLLGLPLTIVAGAAVGTLLFPGMALASVVLLAIMLAPTDAALGHRVISDTEVPARVRQALDVESGLNDGLAVPLFLVALSIANAELKGGVTTAVLSAMGAQIGWGILGGAVGGCFGALAFHLADSRGWIASEWRQILPLASAILAFTVADGLGGSGFIAAFVGGILFGRLAGPASTTTTLFAEEAGEVFAAITWITFGGVVFLIAAPHITWQIIVYALLSLTVVRMLPVFIVMAGSGARMPTKAFIGWFGPRGLASLVFVLIALERGIPEQATVLTTVVVTIALSIVLHGLTSVPLVGVYRKWYAAQAASDPDSEESVNTVLPRLRRQFSARFSRADGQ
ncbi:sodium:proton antiporter [Microbacterium sp. C7(2022)]|uniref:cation:proton antiporter n=1 Tax=Microbacterium sp. C7(2022) TaxID=2992759 RepID=UPI00237AC38C|nr:cation:proton antiporter [Microbacterium sp. C7(2022)]MDE0547637.1 cation:proton antiporter [Microbacterium sp. C7(2022)]